jgi:SsrA-binding protein
MNKSVERGGNVAARNRRARRDFFIEDTIEAGLVLTGTEVKSLRQGKGSIDEAYATERDGELFLMNAYIPEYASAQLGQHEPRRPRKLLVHRKEMERLAAAIARKGMTLVPLELYFNRRGLAKLQLGLAKGKRQHEKRDAVKDRDWKRDQARIMRGRG